MTTQQQAKTSLTLFDRMTALDGVRITPENGYLVGYGIVARSGVQLYTGAEMGRPEMDVVRVYRPPEEVHSEDSLRSMTHKPVCNDHPKEDVTAANWKDLAVGQVGETAEVVQNKFVRVPMCLMDKSAIKAYVGGKRELSQGYRCDIEWTSGIDPATQEAYDAVQRNIRYNHTALVDAARGGPVLRMGDESAANGGQPPSKEHSMSDAAKRTLTLDGLSVEMGERDGQIVQKAITDRDTTIAGLKSSVAAIEQKLADANKASETKVAELTTQLATKDAEIVTLKKQVADAEITPQKLDQMVRDRARVSAQAKALHPQVVVDGKSLDEIRKQVVLAKIGDAAKDWSAESVTASFSTLAATLKDEDLKDAGDGDGGDARDPLALAIGDSVVVVGDKAYTEYDQRLNSAWKGTQARQ